MQGGYIQSFSLSLFLTSVSLRIRNRFKKTIALAPRILLRLFRSRCFDKVHVRGILIYLVFQGNNCARSLFFAILSSQFEVSIINDESCMMSKDTK